MKWRNLLMIAVTGWMLVCAGCAGDSTAQDTKEHKRDMTTRQPEPKPAPPVGRTGL